MDGIRRTRPTASPLAALLASTLAMALVAGACGGGGEATQRTVTVVAADGPSEIVVSTTTAPPTTTTVAPTTSEAPAGTDEADDEATASETSVGSTTTSEDAATTTTVAPTTTVETVKETIPLEEQEIPPGIKMMDALEEFNGCLADDGVEFIGRPDPAKGPEDPVNQPAYIQALTSCASKSGIVDAMQEFQASRVGRTPEQIREDNEQFIVMVGCLRSKGWTVSDPVPDENGSLGPGEDFQGPDGDLDIDDIRACISENNLADG